jgi:hypothetical protein
MVTDRRNGFRTSAAGGADPRSCILSEDRAREDQLVPNSADGIGDPVRPDAIPAADGRRASPDRQPFSQEE